MTPSRLAERRHAAIFRYAAPTLLLLFRRRREAMAHAMRAYMPRAHVYALMYALYA